MSRKALDDTNEMCLCPLGILLYSLNRIFQYGRRIGKKVYSRCPLCMSVSVCVLGGGGMELHDTYKKQMVILRGIIYNCLAYQRVLLNRVTQ